MMIEDSKQLTYSYRDSAWGYLLAVIVPLVFQLIISIIITCVAATKNITGEEFLKTNSAVAAVYYSLSSLTLLATFFVFNKVRKKRITTCAKIEFKFGLKNLLVCICLSLIVLFGFNYFINLLTYLMSLAGYKPDASMPLPLNNVGWLFVNLFVLALVPAVCEELMYRGIILNGLRSKGTHFAVLISALIFAVAHGSAMQFFYQFILGAVLGYVVVRTGSLIASMVVHFLNNATVIVVNYISTVKDLHLDEVSTSWSAFDIVFAICMAIAAAGATILLLSFLKPKKEEVLYSRTNEKFDSLTITLISIAGAISLIIWCMGTFIN